MTRHGLGKGLIITAAVLCLFSVLIIMLGSAGQADPIQTVSNGEPLSTGLSDTPGRLENGSSGTSKGESAGSHSADAADSPASILQSIHYNEKDFFKSVMAAANIKTEPFDNTSPIIGGVVPHHLLAANMIAEFFQTISKDPPSTIVVIAPNHRRIGMTGLHTSSLDWRTSFGILEADRELVSGLIDTLGAAENDSLMELEHSISGLVPYIRYYLPDTRIVPILLHGNYSAADSKRLGEHLADTVQDNPEIMVIASIDFSHYLDTDTADRMDEITLKAIEVRDTQALIRMSNDNIDSPPSILTLLSAMDGLGAEGPLVTGHSNSFIIAGGGADYTTSYYTMLFGRNSNE